MNAFAAITWARSEAPVVRRSNGQPDPTAHHVLLALATYADGDGRGARPTTETLARATCLAEETVTAALRRLTDAGLIAPEGNFGGTGAVVWTLNLALTRPDAPEADDVARRRERALQMAAQRAARHRAKRRGVTVPETVTRNGVEDRPVTVPDTVTGRVTVSETVSHGARDRDVTVSETVSNGAGTVTPAGHSARPALELPLPNCQGTSPPPAAPRATNVTGYTAEFEEFWISYGRKGNKRAAAIAWAKAIKRADPAVIMAKVAPYVDSTPDLQWRKGAESWLLNDGWESAVVSRSPAASQRHQTYRNPVNQDAYDEDFFS